ncbi:MAG: triose-phosphate isomerase [Gammaproteobacteria bacterium]|nr:triose-phosphate isomerase [Gammaproteobacteria bacterium]
MRRALVAGNWKMNGSRTAVSVLVDRLLSGIGDRETTEVAVCPPFPYLGMVAELLAGSGVALGGQNMCEVGGAGAYTGEVSAEMLRDLGCQYVILGHSERRTLYGETDQMVARKFDVASTAGLEAIVCVGELLDERQSGRTEQVVARQLDAILGSQAGVDGLANAVIAYEPVWAIGTGMTATPEQAQQVHAFIRQRIAAHNPQIAGGLRILYGGSVKAANAAELFGQPDIDGGLIGGAALQAEEFLAICRAAHTGR